MRESQRTPALVVLDLAGTTVQDNGEVPDAFTAALDAQGITVSAEQLVAVRGSSKREAIRRLVPEGGDHDARSESAFALFRTQLAERYRRGARAVPRAEAAIAWLRARGARIALNTGFDRETTALLLGALGWDRGVADVVVCGDDVAEGRPAPLLIRRAMQLTGTADAAVVANIGDTTLDLEAGSRAAVRWNIGVTSGAHPRERLVRAPHTHLIDDLGELPSVFGFSAIG